MSLASFSTRLTRIGYQCKMCRQGPYECGTRACLLQYVIVLTNRALYPPACAHICRVMLQLLRSYTGGHEVCPGSYETLGTGPDLQGAAPAAQEGSFPTTGGTGSDSARHSQSPVLSEGGGEDHAVQGVGSTEAG